MLTFQNLVEAMEIDVLRRLALELLHRQPATFADIVSGELPGGNGAPDPDNTPKWCNCGHCMAIDRKLYLPTLTLSTEADFHRGRVIRKITVV